MERKIMEILRRMQDVLSEDQLKDLKDVLDMVFTGCNLVENTSLRVIDQSWIDDLEDFLMSKTLEGKSVETVKRYKYELNRLLSYINKSVQNITANDISIYLRMYKRIRQVSNQTLKNVRTVYSSFFMWLRDHDRISKNPMLLVEDIKVETIIKKPFTDEEREKMSKLLDSGFTDTFRYFYPTLEGAYSWWSYMGRARENNTGWRIDYFLCSQILGQRLKDAKIYPEIFGSDHCPVELDINIQGE